MSDKELLRLAAKAAGFDYSQGIISGTPMLLIRTDKGFAKWNPLTDDGDALRLAVKCSINIYPLEEFSTGRWTCCAVVGWNDVFERVEGDPCAATRRAIVRAAAEIGKTMK